MTRRRILNLVGLLPLLLVLLFSAKIALMLSHDHDGRGAFDGGRYDDAAAAFSGNRSVNVFESWVAAFDEGAARFADGDADGAVTAYRAALADVPTEEECTVRINLALAEEAIGDAKIKMPDRDAALAAWQAGVKALEDGDCPTHSGRGEDQTADAQAVDERLKQKIEQQQPQDQQQQQPQHQDQKNQQNQQDDEKDREKRLEQLNHKGVQDQRDNDELQHELDSDLNFDGQQW
jgi:hypothetical protein